MNCDFVIFGKEIGRKWKSLFEPPSWSFIKARSIEPSVARVFQIITLKTIKYLPSHHRRKL